VLDISRTATQPEIKRAYFVLAKKHHPDLNPGDPGATKRFQRLSEAYQVIGNDAKRQEYDSVGHGAYTNTEPGNYEETFRSTWNEYGVVIIAEYFWEMGAEIMSAAYELMKTGNRAPLIDFLRHRSVFLVISFVPLVLVFRFPALITLAFRLFVGVLLLAFRFLPQRFQMYVLRDVWALMVSAIRRSNQYHTKRKNSPPTQSK